MKINSTGFGKTICPLRKSYFMPCWQLNGLTGQIVKRTWRSFVLSFRLYLEDEFRRADFNHNNRCRWRQSFLRLINLQKNFVKFVRSVWNSRFFNVFWVFSCFIVSRADLAKAADADSVCDKNLENYRELLGCWHIVWFFLQVKVQFLRFNLWP